MSKEYSFSVMPSVSISRSRFVRKSQHKTSFNLGEIVPVYLDEVLPGDTFSIDMADLVRMSTPIAPIMDNIYLDFYAFFVPCRLVWDNWKRFMGENETGAGIPAASYSVPAMGTAGQCVAVTTGSLGDYFGLPIGKTGDFGYHVSALPFRAYFLIYNEWFRDQNLIAPKAINKTDSLGALVGDTAAGVTGALRHGLCKAAKLSDYFTRALPYAQKGQPVSVPLGSTAPVIAGTTMHGMTNKIQLGKNNGSPLAQTGYFGTVSGGSVLTNIGGAANQSEINGIASSSKIEIDSSNLLVDLSNATAATINQLRYAFQLQKFLEKDALYGTRYWEILAAHFGIKAPDASLQRPEYLGGFRQRVNVDQVLSQAGYSDDIQTEVGKPGANSVTGGKWSMFTKSFCEHGYVFILAVARHDQTYSQGLNRMWSRKNRYDYYFPVFANLGAQDVKVREIYDLGDDDYDDIIFGYQEAWAEYRYKPSIATGLLNPTASGALDYWTLTNKFGARPTLGQTFIEQGRDNLQRCLTTGANGPDFIADFYFENVAVRPMPMYSIPGLIDHH